MVKYTIIKFVLWKEIFYILHNDYIKRFHPTILVNDNPTTINARLPDPSSSVEWNMNKPNAPFVVVITKGEIVI